MILIIGGAYQGKLEFARQTFGLSEAEIFRCAGPELDFSRKCIYGLEEFTCECMKKGTDPRNYFMQHREQWQNSILICRDIFCGVVPVEGENRAWRQATGRLCQYLAAEADRVSRIFCGLEQRLK